MIRAALLTAVAILMPCAALAAGSTQYDSDQGAISGRSPQRAHRLLTPGSGCAKAPPMVPAGRLPVFGHGPTLRGNCAARGTEEAGADSIAVRSGS
jgi:hypothetical protein